MKKLVRILAMALAAFCICACAENMKPESLTLSLPEDTLYVGQSVLCTPLFSPPDAAADLVWTSTNPSSVSVSSDGTVTALAYGHSYIKAQGANGLNASVKVTVYKLPTVFALSDSCISLAPGESKQLGYTFSRDSKSSVSFSSKNPGIAQVDDNGFVTACSVGTTLVTAVTSNGLSQCCLVNVAQSALPENVDFEVIFMDIDSNDGIILRCGDEYAFIDSGWHDYGVQAVEFMQGLGITRLKYYIGSHAHLDHIGGACVILDRMEVDTVLVPHALAISAIKSACWTQSEKDAAYTANYVVLAPGQIIYLGDVPITCLGPVRVISVDTSDVAENSNSLILRIDAGNVSMLLTGDATYTEMKQVRDAYPEAIKTDVFKNPHHSAELQDEMIEYLSPKIAVFSTASLRLPSKRYLDVFEKLGCTCYITATRWHSDVFLYTDGENVTVRTVYEDNREAWLIENNVN